MYDLCEPVYAARGYGKPGYDADPNFKEASFSYRETSLSVFVFYYILTMKATETALDTDF